MEILSACLFFGFRRRGGGLTNETADLAIGPFSAPGRPCGNRASWPA